MLCWNYFTEGIQTVFLVSKRVFGRFPECLESCLRISEKHPASILRSVQELTEGFQMVFPVSKQVSRTFPECLESCLSVSKECFQCLSEFPECFLSVQKVA
jgi:hypothetical protein